MLINCPECNHQCSDKAFSCPECGYPFKANINKSASRSNRKKRLPNGFGQISEIKGQNLRKRFRAMVTIGKDDTGRPIVRTLKPIAYFETYNEAYEALLEYNKNPYYIEKTMTMQELYDKWYKHHFNGTLSKVSENRAKMVWDYCHSIYDLQVSEIRAKHIRACIEEAFVIRNGKRRDASEYVKTDIKMTLGQILDYALENDLIIRNYAKDMKISIHPKVEKEHIAFTDEEMQILWDNVENVPNVDMILIQCYMGWRPQELISIKLENINLENLTIVGGIKTAAGINRIVPIHHKILPLIEKNINDALSKGQDRLFTCGDYKKYKRIFDRVMRKLSLNPNHRPHDCRVQFITMAKRYHVDEYAIKKIVGHSIRDVTEGTYTKRELKWYIEELEKIK